MVKYSTEIIINAPVGKVYQYISNLDNATSWITGLVNTELLEGELGKAGTKIKYTFEERGKKTDFIETVISVIPSKKFATNLESKQVKLTTITDLSATQNNGTKVSFYNEVHGKGFAMKLMMPFLKGIMKKRQIGDLSRLKNNIENK